MNISVGGQAQPRLPNPMDLGLVSSGPVAIVNVDLDGDGTLDLAVLDLASRRVLVWFGDVEGGFVVAQDRTRGPRAKRAVRERLTRREREVVPLLLSGHTDREIAARLGIGRRTAESHTASVRAKLGARSRRELMRMPWSHLT